MVLIDFSWFLLSPLRACEDIADFFTCNAIKCAGLWVAVFLLGPLALEIPYSGCMMHLPSRGVVGCPRIA